VTPEPEWLTVADVTLFHDQLIRTFGGAHGLRDAGLLESAIARPRSVFAYESQDLVDLAAALAHGLARNHPFVDGNKRIAFVATRVFLGLNGVAFDPPEAEAVVMVEELAGGQIPQVEYAAWVRKWSRPH
jgi:death-on-curing protein